MARVVTEPTIDANITLAINESEARALNALTAYGDDTFLKVFYEHIGQSVLKEHAAGLVSLFKGVRQNLPFILSAVDRARHAFEDKI